MAAKKDDVMLSPGAVQEVDADPHLEDAFRALDGLESMKPMGNRGGGEDWDAPFDLRVMRPRAVDLVKLWQLWGQSVPPEIAASLGPHTPILLNHVVTPFAKDGRSPGRVWALGYEIVLHDIEANTVGVVPNDEVLRIGKVGQKVELGLDLAGSVSLAEGGLGVSDGTATYSLQNARLRAATGTDVQFALELSLTLRKVIGAPVGIGGAQWKMYRQNEPLDQPHTLLQTLLVPDVEKLEEKAIRCTIKTWATQAGWLGTRIRARFWPYEDQDFTISLEGLSKTST